MSIIPHNDSDVIVIPLTQGKETIIDAIDADLAGLKWYAYLTRGRFYARRATMIGVQKQKVVQIHRVILERIIERELINGEYCDHINNDPLDNRRLNLRVATAAENARNRKILITNKSGYKGVSWSKSKKKWEATICVGKNISLGTFDNIEDAAQAYADASKKYHGEFGRLE